jgi:DNA-binding transcriptional LysR family regulator
MSFETTQLAPAVIDFASAFPEIQLEVNLSDRVANLINEGFDVAVRISSYPIAPSRWPTPPVPTLSPNSDAATFFFSKRQPIRTRRAASPKPQLPVT